jgi:hypothetical protein
MIAMEREELDVLDTLVSNLRNACEKLRLAAEKRKNGELEDEIIALSAKFLDKIEKRYPGREHRPSSQTMVAVKALVNATMCVICNELDEDHQAEVDIVQMMLDDSRRFQISESRHGYASRKEKPRNNPKLAPSAGGAWREVRM